MPERKIGVLLCDCGGEISRTIDYTKLNEYVSKLKNVKFVRKHGFLCGEEGKDEIESVIRKGADTIVIAACSPKLYELHFRKNLKESGLNPYLLEMVNLREQCAWPHLNDVEGANEKAKRLISAGVEKARRIPAIETKDFQTNKSALIIGAGVAGLQAAMDISEFGYETHLVEKAAVVGGNALKLGLAFPTDDGAFCITSPSFLTGIRKCFYRSGLTEYPNLNFHTLSEVKSTEGSCGDFEVKITSQPRGVRENLCINCGKCAEVCQVEVADEMNYGLSNRKAIYLPYPNALPPVYVVDWKNCSRCGKCVEVCPTNAIDLNDKPKESTLRVGAIVVATGFQEYDPINIKQYNYDLKRNVITQLQLSRLLDPYGPTGGKLIRPSDGKTPEKIVIIQCVGSRDKLTNPYCSNICCMIGLKHAIHIKQQYGSDSEVYLCYMDVRAVGKDYEEYFEKARDLGVSFIRGKPSQILRDPLSGNLTVEVEDTLLNMPLKIKADMVVLSMAMTPSTGTKNLAEILGIEVGNSGFLEEIYPKLKPVETKVKGIYVCGCAHGPKDIPDSVTQAEAAAFKVIFDLSQEKIGKDMDIAYIDEDLCDACKVCVDVCPFNAIEMVDITKEGKPSSVARINEIKCNRCGSCASRCPTGAVQLRRYNDELVLGQLKQLLSKKNDSMSPKIVAFCCDECGYATVDLAGMSHEEYPVNVLPIRVPCLGWVSLYQIFKALETGADGVLLVGCMIDTCQNLKGALYAEKTVAFAKEILDEIGLNGSRIKMVPVCAADATKFIKAAKSLLNDVKSLKPIKTKIGGAKNG